MAGKNICVAFETTGARLGISIFDANGAKPALLAETFRQTGPQQSELLIPELEKLLKKARLSKRDIRFLAVDTGPGSFTGVRVGVSAARALAQALKIPLIGISSLEAMAWSVRDAGPNEFVTTCIPALQGEVYFAGFQNKGGHFKVAHSPVWKKIEEFDAYLRSLFAKSGVIAATEAWREDLIDLKGRYPAIKWISKPVAPHSGAIGLVAIERFRKSSRRLRFENVVPEYLQPSWAERKKDAVASSR